MSTRVLLEEPLRWIDVVAPSREELQAIAAEYALHPTSVQDCLDPEHLPKVERIQEILFVIVRGYDELAPHEADTMQGLTRKVAIFKGPGFLITIQRSEQPYLAELKQSCRATPPGTEPPQLQVMVELLKAVVNSYARPLEDSETRIESFESAVFSESPRRQEALSGFREIHRLKQRLSVLKRMLWHTSSVIQKLNPPGDASHSPLMQDLREECESMFVFSDELTDDVNALLNIQLSLSSHRMAEASNQTNDVMRVLTVFSAFFMPLTFIVGVYGMNFANIPELHLRYGYGFVWIVMIATTAAVYLWFRRRGWLK